MRKLTRMEANKEVRRVLHRHGVDLSYAQYSVCGMDIRLTGWLCKTDTTDFNGVQIEGMIQEFQRILPNYSISGDFDNWNFNSEHISYLGEKTEEMKDEEEEKLIADQHIGDWDSEAS